MVKNLDRMTIEKRFMALCDIMGLDYNPDDVYSDHADGDTRIDCPHCEGSGMTNTQTEWGSNRDAECPKCNGASYIVIPDGKAIPDRYSINYSGVNGGWCITIGRKGGSIIGDGMDSRRVPSTPFATMLEYMTKLVELSGRGVRS